MSVETGVQELSRFATSETRAKGGGVRTGYSATPADAGVPCIATQGTRSWRNKEQGVDRKAVFRVVVGHGWSFARRDVLKITAGEFENTYLMVLDVRPNPTLDEVVLDCEETLERPDA